MQKVAQRRIVALAFDSARTEAIFFAPPCGAAVSAERWNERLRAVTTCREVLYGDFMSICSHERVLDCILFVRIPCKEALIRKADKQTTLIPRPPLRL